MDRLLQPPSLPSPPDALRCPAREAPRFPSSLADGGVGLRVALGTAASSRGARGSGHWHRHTAWGLGTVGTAPSARPPLAPTRSRPLPALSLCAHPFQSRKGLSAPFRTVHTGQAILSIVYIGLFTYQVIKNIEFFTPPRLSSPVINDPPMM